MKKTVGKQFIQVNDDMKIKSSKKRSKESKKRHKMVTRDTMKSLTALIFTQMTRKKGIEQFGDVSTQAILEEYTQLHNLNVFKPKHKRDLKQEQIDKCLRLITLIKQKRCGKIKGEHVQTVCLNESTSLKRKQKHQQSALIV